jgi:arginyl-tRNA synthetase
MTFEGNSGPYIQYAYVRARNILAKADFETFKKVPLSQAEKSEGQRGLFQTQEETSLLKSIFAYPSILEETVK